MKKIGILGSGNVGRTLGKGFIKHGYEVMLGTREPAKLADWKTEAGDAGRVGSFEETAAFGELVVLAVGGSAAESVLEQIGSANLAGKTIIDTTNPIDHSRPPVNGVLHYFTSSDESLMERLQKQVPEAHFVKAFNSVGNAFMVDPQFPGGKPTMFICGNNNEAKAETAEILERFGWESEDMGMVESARPIEALCILWCAPGFQRGQWTHAFKLLKMN